MALKYKLFMIDLKWILEKLPIKNGERIGQIFKGGGKNLGVLSEDDKGENFLHLQIH